MTTAVSKDFNRDRQDWLEDVLRDAHLTHATFKVAYLIASYINRQNGKAWPTQETLAKRANMTDRALRPILQSLVEGGYLLCEPGRGRHKPNIYQLAHKNRKPASALLTEKGEVGFPLSEEKTGSSASENRKFSAQKPEAGFLQNLMKEPYEEPRAHFAQQVEPDKRKPVRVQVVSPARKSKPSRQAIPEGILQRFRAAYPRRKGSNWTTAADLFERALKNGADPEAIIAGASAYARQCALEGNTGDRSKFIKLVETWLRARGWEADYDDAAAPVVQMEITPDEWLRALATFHNTGEWAPRRHGPEPGAPGCRVPAQYLSQNLQRGVA